MKFIIYLILILNLIKLNYVNGFTFSILAFSNKYCDGEPTSIESKNICVEGGQCFQISQDNKFFTNLRFQGINESKEQIYNVNECISFSSTSSSVIITINENEDNVRPLEGYCNEIVYYDKLLLNSGAGGGGGIDSGDSEDDNCQIKYIYSTNISTCDNNRKKICKDSKITYLDCKSCLSPNEECTIIPNDKVNPKPKQCSNYSVKSKKYTYRNIFSNNSLNLNSLISNSIFMSILLISLLVFL